MAPSWRTLPGALACLAVGLGASPAPAAHLAFQGAIVDGVGGVDGLGFAQDIALSPDGLHAYVAAEADASVTLFARDGSSGALTFVQKWTDGEGGVDGIGYGTSVAVSGDGKHVYVTGAVDDALAVFSRDPVTGLLTFVEMLEDGVGGVDGLNYPLNVVIAPDGKHLYVAANDDNAVSVFARDADTGALTFVEVEKEGVGGVSGLLDAVAPAVSPDGAHVYVAADSSNAVAVFARDAGTGALTFVEAQVDGTNGVDGIAGAYSVLVSADGEDVYVGGIDDHGLAAFSRNATTGALTYLGAHFDDTAGVDGIWWPLSLAESGDGTKVYVAGRCWSSPPAPTS